MSLGPRALLVEVDGSRDALALADWARRAPIGAVEVVPGATTVLLDGLSDPDGARRLLAQWPGPGPDDAVLPVPVDTVRVPVTYDGADLETVAAAWGTDRAGVAARLAEVAFTAAFCGFAPGFTYLGGLPDELAVPRLDSPRTRVPAGSVALAGSWCGIYPTASPGGWRIVGRTDVPLWDAERASPALLPPGTRVRLVVADPR